MLVFHLEIKTWHRTVHVVNLLGWRFEEVTCLEDICFLPSSALVSLLAPQQPDGRNLLEQPTTIH